MAYSKGASGIGGGGGAGGGYTGGTGGPNNGEGYGGGGGSYWTGTGSYVKGGWETFTAPDGSSEVGHLGNGCVRISPVT